MISRKKYTITYFFFPQTICPLFQWRSDSVFDRRLWNRSFCIFASIGKWSKGLFCIPIFDFLLWFDGKFWNIIHYRKDCLYIMKRVPKKFMKPNWLLLIGRNTNRIIFHEIKARNFFFPSKFSILENLSIISDGIA